MSDQELAVLKIDNQESAQSGRLLLLSNLANSVDRRKNKTQDRKTKTLCETFEYADTTYRVNVKKSGIYKEIMTKIVEQLIIAREALIKPLIAGNILIIEPGV